MGNIALITGASSGFGKACARLFVENGWKVILTARRIERLKELAEELGKSQVLPLELDITRRTQVEATIETLPDEWRNIDLLINNAGLALGLEPSWEVDLDDWDTMVDTNVKGVMYMCRAVLPVMVKNNHGYIINIGSTAGQWPYKGGNVYGGTKAFVDQFSKNLRTDLQGTLVRVTNLAPGMAESEFSVVRFKGDKASADNVYTGTKPIQPEDIANTCYWLASQPAHINVNTIEIMPTCQSWSALHVQRDLDIE